MSNAKDEVVIVDAVRTPFGKRSGALSTMHAIDLLGLVQRALFERTGFSPELVGQVIGGCIGQVGMQSSNITRTSWLAAGLPLETPATTIDTQCGSSQQATSLAYSLIASGVVDAAVACGVEVMSKVPLGATTPKDPDVGKPFNRTYWNHYEVTTQFEGAERVAEKWGITRQDTDEFGKRSQDRAELAWGEGRFDTQIIPVAVGESNVHVRDEGLRATTLEGLAKLKPTGRADGVHTAGSSSQIADGAAAVLLMTRAKAQELGMSPLATILDVNLVGCDPVLMLEGPIPATQKLLARNNLTMNDIDVVEINEAFASVVLAWERTFNPDLNRVNPNGGAIAMGHPLGATGAALLTKAAHELTRTDGTHALITMCCGGGLGTGTLLRRN
jgi:acetyl-CoA C-acetyltransferase